MKKLNKKSECYYIVKGISVPALNICKAHLVDDNCNEFTVTLNIAEVFTGYVGTHINKNIIDVQEYDRFEWDFLRAELDYIKAKSF